MKKEYTVEENGVIWYEENGFRYSFEANPNNSDYQAYLNKDKQQVEHFTQNVTITEPPTEQTQEGAE